VATIFQFGEEGDAYFYAMEFVEGEDWDRYVARQGPLSPAAALRVMLQIGRFMAWQLYGLLAGGSRERLEAWQFYGAVVSAAPNRCDGQNIALGHSREPPATNR
jgi:hypothetical protein